MAGHFITFEGGDGAGKSTLIQGLVEALESKGHDVMQTRAPGGTPAGQTIRELLLHPADPLVARAELLLYLADRAEQLDKVILPALNQGKVVLCDRYNDSTLAYQGKARGLSLEEVRTLCDFATNSLQPDLTLYLDIDPSIGLERVRQSSTEDQIEGEGLSFHQTVRSAFHELAAADPARFRIIDASQSKETVLQESLKQIEDSFARK